MALYAIGDIQGCDSELGALLKAIQFDSDRDQVWFVGDLVNRGPESLQALRRIRALGAAATVVLGNHDLHLLAVAFGFARLRRDDTVQDILGAADRNVLLEWLLTRPLLHEDTARKLCLLHAGLAPQWDIATARACARDFEQALQHDPRAVLEHMYGDEPDCWDEKLAGPDRLRFTVNCFTRLRYVDTDGRLVLGAKGAPKKSHSRALIPWFDAGNARWHGTRVIFGHWSTLGFLTNSNIVSLDTGCVWGGQLTAFRIDAPDGEPVQVGCRPSCTPD